MKELCETVGEPLSDEERNLLSVAYKNVVGARRSAWRVVLSMIEKESTSDDEDKRKCIKEYQETIKKELQGICKEVLVSLCFTVAVCRCNLSLLCLCLVTQKICLKIFGALTCIVDKTNLQ